MPEAALAEANAALSGVEAVLNTLDKSRDISKLQELDSRMDNARTEIGTALLEYGNTVSEEETPTHPVIVARNRWRSLDRRLQKLKAEREVRLEVQPWLLNAVTAAVAPSIPVIDASAAGWPGGTT